MMNGYYFRFILFLYIHSSLSHFRRVYIIYIYCIQLKERSVMGLKEIIIISIEEYLVNDYYQIK